MNQVLLEGTLVKAVKYTNFRSGAIKVNGMIKTLHANPKTGKDLTNFVPVEAWNENAEMLIKDTKEGTKIRLKGSYTSGSYEKDGKKIYTHTILADQVKVVEEVKVLADTVVPF